MRLMNVAGRLMLVVDGRGIDVERASGGRFASDPQAVYDRWEEFRMWARQVGPDAGVPINGRELGAPTPAPTQVFAIGLNYMDHARESGAELPAAPPTFTKFPTCLTGPFGAIHLPSRFVDWEVELVAVLGRRAYRVAEGEAWDHIAGLTVGQDLSERMVQLRPPAPQFSLGKSFPDFGPTGPVLVTPDELTDPDDLAIECRLNGEVVQSARTSSLIFSVPRLVAELSAVLPLLPGDVIFTRTPSGVGGARTPPRFLAPGDVLTSTIEGIGTMEHTFVGE